MFKNKKAIIILIAILSVAIIIAAAVILNPQTSEKELSSVLTKYFVSYYKTGNVNDLMLCLPTEIREEADLAYTLGGALNLLTNYANDTKAQLGDNFDVIVKITKRTEPTAALRNQYKTQFYNVSMAISTAFDVELKGAEKSLKFKGTSDMVRIGNNWFLTNYSIPLYEQN